MGKETRFNEQTWVHDVKHELWLSEYDSYVLAEEFQFRVSKLQYMRDKCGISPEDKDSEPNKHIAVIVKVCEQLGLEIKV